MRGFNGNFGCESYYNHYTSGYFNFWPFIFLALVIVLAVVFIFIIKSKKATSNDVLEDLKALYIRGEITEDEYLKRKQVLKRK